MSIYFEFFIFILYTLISLHFLLFDLNKKITNLYKCICILINLRKLK